MSLLSKVFSSNENEILDLLKVGALIIDVRNPGEFERVRIEGSLNIPLPQIKEQAQAILDLNRPIVFCCAAGVRSGKATLTMKKKGLNCANGGSWQAVKGLQNNISQ